MEATDLVNKFTSKTYPPGTNGRSEVPLEDIHNELREVFPHGWECKVTHAGLKPDGRPYVVVSLTLTGEDGFRITVPGAAEADDKLNFGFSGILGMAIRNAVLRHLGMGEELYVSRPEDIVRTGKERTTTSDAAPGWDGSKKIKTGKFMNKPWYDVPDRSVEFMATQMSPPNPDAVKELARRQGAKNSQPVTDPFDTVPF